MLPDLQQVTADMLTHSGANYDALVRVAKHGDYTASGSGDLVPLVH